MKNEVRPIDANALAQKIKEYMEGFPNAETRLAAYQAVLSMLGDEGQTPTLTDHFRDLTKMVPLTLEQLWEMDGQPVLYKRSNQWFTVELRNPDFGECIINSAGFFIPLKTAAERGLYAYHSAHIDREVWKPLYIGKWNVDGCNENALATNADQIRAMSDEELAKWLAGQAGKEPSDDPAVWMDWLKQPAEENRP